ncbi:MAG: glycosyltransferase [Methanocellales archaeon]|nr:glycosyltransferase [Methanocellales archaeon]
MPMKISVVINAYNEEENIAGCIESLLAQSRRADEILVVDNGSTDKTTEIASNYPVRIIKLKYTTRGHARDVGWRSAKGDLICYADADDLLNDVWIEEIEKKVKEGADAVIDRIEVHKPETFFLKCYNAYYDVRYIDYTPFSAWAFKREVLDGTGGFRDIWIEDIDLGTRLLDRGYKIMLAERAVRSHKGKPRSFYDFLKREFTLTKHLTVEYYQNFPKKCPHNKFILAVLFLFLTPLAVISKFILYTFLLSLAIIYLAIFVDLAFRKKGWSVVRKRYLFGLALIIPIGMFFRTLGFICGKCALLRGSNK